MNYPDVLSDVACVHQRNFISLNEEQANTLIGKSIRITAFPTGDPEDWAVGLTGVVKSVGLYSLFPGEFGLEVSLEDGCDTCITPAEGDDFIVIEG